MGIAIDQGFIEGVDAQVLSFFPDMPIKDADEKNSIDLKSLLTMSSGLEWDEWTYDYFDPRNIVHNMLNSSSEVNFVLNQSVVAEPGSLFTYNSGISIVIGAVIQQAANMTLEVFAQQYLFEPLNITSEQVDWPPILHGFSNSGWGLHMTPRALAKIGYLMTQQGNWDGTQVVSEVWIEVSTAEHITSSSRPYGYQWWLNPEFNGYQARGYQGQRLVVIPEENLVVVFTSNLGSTGILDTILMNHVFSAVKSISGTSSQSITSIESNFSMTTNFNVYNFLAGLVFLIVIRKKKFSN